MRDHILDSITRRWLLRTCDIAERPIAADEPAGIREAYFALGAVLVLRGRRLLREIAR